MHLSSHLRSFIADTLALVSFFTVTSGLNERFVAGMEWSEVLSSRAIGAVLMVLTARPYGLWRNWLLGWIAPQTRWTELLADGFALLLFQVPIYLAIIAVAGAKGSALICGALGFAGLMLVLGRPYGLWLEWVRRQFGLSGPGQKPMSLGG